MVLSERDDVKQVFHTDIVVGQDQNCDYSGTTDVPIRAAITAANTAGGGVVLIKEGTYNIGASLSFTSYSNVIVRGMGWGTKLILDNGIDSSVLVFTTSNNIIIENLYIDGNKDNQTYGYGVKLAGCSDVIINKVYTYHCRTHGITAEVQGATNCTNIMISNCRSDANREDGIVLANCSQSTITGCVCSNAELSSANGIACYSTDASSTKNTITGNVCYGNGAIGINLEGSNFITASSNVCYDNVVGINTLTTGGGQAGYNNIISNNIVHSNSNIGIQLSGVGVTNIIINGNQVYNSGNAGIQTAADLTDITITNNISTSNGTYGVKITAGCDYIILTSNNLRGNTTASLNGSVGANGVDANNIKP